MSDVLQDIPPSLLRFSLHVLARARTLAVLALWAARGSAPRRANARIRVTRWPLARPSFDGLRAFRDSGCRDGAKNGVLPVRIKNGRFCCREAGQKRDTRETEEGQQRDSKMGVWTNAPLVILIPP